MLQRSVTVVAGDHDQGTIPISSQKDEDTLQVEVETSTSHERTWSAEIPVHYPIHHWSGSPPSTKSKEHRVRVLTFVALLQ